MIEINSKQNCCGCYACYNICPKQCITMKADNEGFWYPNIDKNKCINCNLCENVCPIINKPKSYLYEEKSYAVFNKDEKIRLESSSGGIFSLLAEYVINKYGIVYGAVFDEEFNVKHIKITSLKDIELLRGSKYVQSKINDIFKSIKFDLINNKLVLFTGTPCQIAGLQSFLQRKYDNLILMDIVCHGVPSPLIWQKYINKLKKNYKQNIKTIYFRDKSTGWKKYSIKFLFDKDEYKNIGFKDIYMKGFLNDIYLRPSCYNCKFKGIERISDITVADFWGIENIFPKIDDDKGTSLVVIHTEKGKRLFDKLSEKMIFNEVNLNEVVKYNLSMVRSAKYNKKREPFFVELNFEKDIENLIRKYTKKSFIQLVKYKIKSII